MPKDFDNDIELAEVKSKVILIPPGEEAQIFQPLDAPLREEEAIMPPNAETVEEIVRAINDGQSPPAISSAVGKTALRNKKFSCS